MTKKEFDAEINSVSNGTTTIYVDPKDRPTHITTDYVNGPITKLMWTNKKGKYHRINKPAIIEYIYGEITNMAYYTDGVLNRINKPAIFCISSNWCQWWENGIFIKEEQIT